MSAEFAALRKRAKRWLKAIRSGDASALAEFERQLPGHARAPGLREVQQALAREQGHASWAALKEHFELRALDLSGLAAEFLRQACLSYQADDWPSKWRRAERIRVRTPQVARVDLYTAAVSGELEQVRKLLRNDPSLASLRGGPQHWPPLLFVCYGRLPRPEAAANALEIARALLDAGADPNAYFVTGDGSYRFTALTGAIGQGELGQPEHPHAEALAQLLLERGASPDDAQALYNTHLMHDDPRWLKFLCAHGLTAEARVNWQSGAATPPKILEYLLPQAAANGHIQRLRCLLDHGANPNARSTYNRRSSYQNALIAGQLEIAQTLLEHGATAEPLLGREAWVAACTRNDAAEAARLLEGHREYLDHVQPLIDAAAAGKLDTLELFLKLGMDPNGSGIHGHRALHVSWQHRAITELLLRFGADPRSRCFGGTVSGWARHGGDIESARYHAEHSRSLLDAAASGQLELARELLAAEPSCVREVSPDGDTALHQLPEDFDRAAELLTLLLAHGADPHAVNKSGQTPAQRLEALGLDEIADLVESTI